MYARRFQTTSHCFSNDFTKTPWHIWWSLAVCHSHKSHSHTAIHATQHWRATDRQGYRQTGLQTDRAKRWAQTTAVQRERVLLTTTTSAESPATTSEQHQQLTWWLWHVYDETGWHAATVQRRQCKLNLSADSLSPAETNCHLIIINIIPNPNPTVQRRQCKLNLSADSPSPAETKCHLIIINISIIIWDVHVCYMTH